MDVSGGRVHMVMTHERLHHRHVDTGLGQRGPEAVAQGMGMASRNPSPLSVLAEDTSHPLIRQGLTAARALGHHEQGPL